MNLILHFGLQFCLSYIFCYSHRSNFCYYACKKKYAVKTLDDDNENDDHGDEDDDDDDDNDEDEDHHHDIVPCAVGQGGSLRRPCT